MNVTYHIINNGERFTAWNYICQQWRRHVGFRVFLGTPWPKKKNYIYKNLNFIICLPIRKKKGTPSTKSGTLSTFLWQTNFELKSFKKKKKLVTEQAQKTKKPNINPKQNQPQPDS